MGFASGASGAPIVTPWRFAGVTHHGGSTAERSIASVRHGDDGRACAAGEKQPPAAGVAVSGRSSWMWLCVSRSACHRFASDLLSGDGARPGTASHAVDVATHQ